jgi:hypothetical protein
MALFQGATDLYIAGKVSAQTFQYDNSKMYINQALNYIWEVLKIFRDEPYEFVIEEQLKSLILQIHEICNRENYFINHLCDIGSFETIRELSVHELINSISEHITKMDLEHDQILWLSVIDKGGLTIFSYDFTGKADNKRNTLYSSFIFAVSKWGEKELSSGPATELTFSGNTIMIESLELIDVIVVATKSSIDIKNGVIAFANAFFKTNEHHLRDWNGSTTVFEHSKDLVKRYFSKFLKS